MTWACQAYAGSFVVWIGQAVGRAIDLVIRPDFRGFAVLPKRWIVERTFA